MQVETIVSSEQLVAMKVCIDCVDKTPKPISEFSKHRSRRGGLKDRCKDCDKAYQFRQRKKWRRSPRMPVLHPSGNKQCTVCEQEKPYSDFIKNHRTKDGYEYYCRVCRAVKKLPYRRENMPERRVRMAAAIFRMKGGKGLSSTEQKKVVAALLSKQVCDICGKPETSTNQHGVKSLAIDHCHITGKFRGLLCFNCNTALGRFGDDPVLLLKAAAYLSQFCEEAS